MVFSRVTSSTSGMLVSDARAWRRLTKAHWSGLEEGSGAAGNDQDRDSVQRFANILSKCFLVYLSFES